MGKATRHIIIFFGKPKGRWKRVDLFMILYSLCPLGEILSYELCGGCKIVVLRDRMKGLIFIRKSFENLSEKKVYGFGILFSENNNEYHTTQTP